MPNKLPQFWKELRRRKVINVYFWYAGAAIVLIGLADEVAGPFNCPEGAQRLVIILAVIGAPLVMVFSWIFDITPEGIKRTTSMERSNWDEAHLPDYSSDFKGSIAVLPFKDMSPNKDQEYFCEGISEEIINSLSRVESLKVIARTSAFAFKDQSIDIREIGQKLQVSNSLEGSLRKDGRKLRITAQLIRVEDGFHLWSEVYDRDLKDVFKIQEDIALEITKNLNIKILGKEKEAIEKSYTVDLEAYDLHLKGLYIWQRMTPEANKEAVQYYKASIEKDPQFALGYSILAGNYGFTVYAGFSPPKYALPKAKELTLKAIEIDDTVTVAYANLAMVTAYYDWNWEAGEEIMLKGLRLIPNSGWDHWYYAMLLLATNRYEKAITEAKRALELDPFNVFINIALGNLLFLARKYDLAMEKLLWSCDMYPDNFFAFLHLGEVYRVKEKFPQAIEAFEKAVQFSRGVPMAVSRLAWAYQETGRSKEAEELIKQLEQRREKTGLDKYQNIER
jgi:TolB-like protein/Tfp pilus assembly protein PilF